MKEKEGSMITDWLDKHGNPEIEKIVERKLEEISKIQTMEITKNNICQKIEDYLKEKKLNFNILDQNDRGLNYEIYLGSSEAHIQVEYDLTNDDDNSVYLQLYTKLDEYGDSFYHQDWDSGDINADSVEGEIDNLVDSTISLTKAYSKINSKIDQIRDLCIEYNIDFDEIITIHVDLE